MFKVGSSFAGLFALLAVVALLGFACRAEASEAIESTAVTAAQEAAASWLSLADSLRYDQSWETAASLFRAAVSKADWGKALGGVRGPLGAVRSRKLKSATFTRSLPAAPDGEYVVIQFETQFANKAAAIETVTPMKDKDGKWRVSGYYIR